jgi:hypothetical protein
MLIAYLDDSDAENAIALSIAGYVAEADGWAIFEEQAEKVCAEFGVDVLHCREFDYRQKCFRGWSVPTTIGFLHKIGDALVAGNVLFGVSRSVPKAHYKTQKAELDLDHNTSAYCHGFATIVHSLRYDEPFGVTAQVEAEGISYKVESGHKNNDDLARHIAEQVEKGVLHKDTKIEFVEKVSCRAIQIADLYAFYSRRRANRWAPTRGQLRMFPDKLQLHLESRVPHFTGYIEEPYRTATVQRSGLQFQVKGIVTAI